MQTWIDTRLCQHASQHEQHALLLHQEHARHLTKQSTNGGLDVTEGTPWTGLGSDHPGQVEGLRNVQSVSLGGVHAMAIVDDDDTDDSPGPVS